MNHFRKLKTPSVLKLLSSNFLKNKFEPFQTPSPLHLLSPHFTKNPIFYSNRPSTRGNYEEIPIPKCNPIRKPKYSRIQLEAQSALQEYLHDTRDMSFLEAEYISKNCPNFVNKLLNEIEGDNKEIMASLAKLFRYHPVNEFEPFYESIGLMSAEIDLFLPRDKMFLKDDYLLLENYRVLCDYGVSRRRMIGFFKFAMEVFRYDHGILRSKLRAYEDLGLSKTNVIKVVVSSPYLLIGPVNDDFVRMLDLLERLGVEFKWIEEGMNEKNSYDWSRMLDFLGFVGKLGYSKEELQTIIKNHPSILLDGSGRYAFHLVGLLLKFGLTGDEISSLLLHFPQVNVGIFMKNLRRCLLFFMEIEMEAQELGNIVRAHPHLLGSCSLKKTNSILSTMNVGKNRLCNLIKEDPSQLRKMVLGLKLEPLPNSGEDERSLMQKTEFLLKLGFTEKSDELKKALKVFRGKGGELQDRFEGLLEAGINVNDAIEIVKEAPHIMNQSKDVIKQKIDFLVNGLGYPISALVTFPYYTNFTTERVKLRF